MSKRQSGASAVVVCDDAISGSESDKDVADELRLSMEGLPTDSYHFPIVFFALISQVYAAFDKRIAEVENEQDLELCAEFRRIEECRRKNLEVAKTHFQCRLKSIEACFPDLQFCLWCQPIFNLFSRASTSLMFVHRIMRQIRHELPPKRAL